MNNAIVWLKKIWPVVLKHKVVSSVVVIIVVGGGYWQYKKMTAANAPTQYVLGVVERGTLTVSVSGSGQVATTNQIDLKPQVSGAVTRVYVAAGQEVSAGTLLVSLDAGDAARAVRDAELSLESARLSYTKLTRPADSLSLIQAQNALEQAKISKQNAIDDLKKAHEDGFNTVANAFLDLPTVVTGLHDTLFTGTILNSQWNIDYYGAAIQKYEEIQGMLYQRDAKNSYESARIAYEKNFSQYKIINRLASDEVVENLINQTYATTKNISDAVKNANNFLQLYQDTMTAHSVNVVGALSGHLAGLSSYTAKINTNLTNLLNIKNTIESSKDAIASADRTIAEKTESLTKLESGADTIDVQSQELTIRQRVAALSDARAKLADYYIRAPITGIVAKVNMRIGDQAGSGTAVATLIAKQQIAQIALNEVDVAKVKVGQKATLTFDAVDGLGLTGVVSEIDTIGTVTQGVVSYNVKITFDTQDDRVKPGMSVSTAIITDVQQNVFIVPNSAVKMRSGRQYVELLDNPIVAASGAQGVTSDRAPREQVVTTGLANDSEVEIVSGVHEGDQIITRTITATAKTTTTAAPSLFPTGGGNRGTGGTRIGG